MLVRIQRKSFSNFSKNLTNFDHEFCEKFTKVYLKKHSINNLLKEKIFHFSILGYETKELGKLQELTDNQVKNMKNISLNHSLKLPQNQINFTNLFMLSTLGLSYSSFLDLIRMNNESIEEEVNELIRIGLENDYFEKYENLKILLISLRDEWRNFNTPEVLNSNHTPIYERCLIEEGILKINDQILNKL